jgi:hypothetical protein
MSYSSTRLAGEEADHRHGGIWIMRPTLVLGFLAAFAAAVTIDASVHADPTPPQPTFAVSGGSITVTAQGNTHVNNQFPWYVKDGTGTKVKQLTDFAFTGGSATAPTVAAVKGAPAAGTLRGGYCQDTGCYTFTASCTASSCTITGT